jgi:hypothetical protein
MKVSDKIVFEYDQGYHVPCRQLTVVIRLPAIDPVGLTSTGKLNYHISVCRYAVAVRWGLPQRSERRISLPDPKTKRAKRLPYKGVAQRRVPLKGTVKRGYRGRIADSRRLWRSRRTRGLDRGKPHLTDDGASPTEGSGIANGVGKGRYHSYRGSLFGLLRALRAAVTREPPPNAPCVGGRGIARAIAYPKVRKNSVH